MKLAVIGSLLNLAVAFIPTITNEYPSFLIYITVPCALISLIGVALVAGGSKKFGSYLIMTGSFVFIPLGLIAAYGGKKILSAHNHEKFKKNHRGE